MPPLIRAAAHPTSRLPSVRLYHFLSAEYALDDIAKRRIKISQIEQLNDPFELWCVYQRDRSLRDALRLYKRDMNDQFGMLCFSKHWHNPVLWSHYADRHQGICLGFDIDRQRVNRVVYKRQRLHLALQPSQKDVEQLLYTKFVDWQYEEECRSWIRLDERDPTTRLYFYTFDRHVRLREVIAGPLCGVTEAKLKDALWGYEDEISTIKARLAFRSFRIVKNNKGFLQNRTAS